MSIGKTIYNFIDNIRRVMVVILFSIIIISCFVDVVLRYVPCLKSLGWTEEILRYLNVWIIFLGAGFAAKKGTHLAMTYFRGLFKPKHQAWIIKATYVAILIFLAIFTIFGAIKTIENIQQQVQAFPITIAWFYLAIPVGFFYMFIDYLLILIYGYHPFLRLEEEK